MWIADSRAHDSGVLANVVLAEKRIRGMEASELAGLVHESAERFSSAAVEVQTPGGSLNAAAPELGLSVDEPRTVAEALAAGRRGAAPRRLWLWARSFLWPVKVPLTIAVERRTLDRVVAERDPIRVPPVEPSLTVKDDRLDGVAGEPGRGINPSSLADKLSRANPVGGRLVVAMKPSSVPPRFAEVDADRLAAEGENLANGGLEVSVAGETTAVPAATLRRWLRAVPQEEALVLGVRPDADIAGDLTELLPNSGTPPVNAGFTVSGGRVSITASRTGTACCAPETTDAIAAVITDPAKRASPVELPLRTVEPDRNEEAALKLGIVEQISTFTTPHAAGEPRVRNIQRMADTLRGTVIEPGATFSINGLVGRRTTEKGYVEAPIISSEYKFEADVGGGVSQFAATMFNAAFFGGLDIDEYAMHGLYISRYPYGREATLSFPSPDLKVRNSTPYGVLVWPTYTDSSITVTLYSTKHVTGEQTGQTLRESRAKPPPDAPPDTPVPGPCVTVTTERTRTYLGDSRTVVDRFSAQYAPAEGWSCA